MIEPLAFRDRPIQLRIAPGSGDLADALPPVTVTVKSDLMESYDNAQPLDNAGDIRAMHVEGHGLVTFSIGVNRRLHLIRSGKSRSAFWQHAEIGKDGVDALGTQQEAAAVESFDVAHVDGGATLLMCVGRGASQEILLSDRVDVEQPERTAFRPLGIPAGNKVEAVRVMSVPSSERMKDEVHCLAITRSPKAWIESYRWHEGRWHYLQPEFDQDKIVDVQLGNTRALGPGLYILYESRGRRRFTFTEFSVGAARPARSVAEDGLVNPRAFTVETLRHGPNRGYTEVYLVDQVSANESAILHLSADEQGDTSQAGWQRLGGRVVAAAEQVFVTHNDAGRRDVYVHSSAGGELVHLFRNEITGNWCPAYTLARGIRRLAPASSVSGRVCELFGVGATEGEVSYLWQDQGTSAWSRDVVRIQATDRAVPVRTAQTRITFAGPDGELLLPPKLDDVGPMTITSSESVNVRINDVPHVLPAGVAVRLDPKSIMNGIDLVAHVHEADAPFFTLKGNIFSGGALTVHPLAKVKDDLAQVNADRVLTPVDRFGDRLDKPLVEGPRATREYLESVLPGVNELARMQRADRTGGLALLSESPDAALMRREGVWFEPETETFDTSIDLGALPDGYAFGIDFSGATPAFLDSTALGALGLAGQEQGESIWSDLAKWFGAFLEELKNTAEKIVTFVAEKVTAGVKFMVKIADEWITCLATRVEQAMKAINTLLAKTLGIDFEAVLRWLGAVFDLRYIREVQKGVAATVKQGLRGIAPMIDQYKEVVLARLDGARKALTEGELLFRAKGVRDALETRDTPRLREIFAANGVPVVAEVRSRKDGTDWLMEDAHSRWIVRDGAGTDEVRASFRLPGTMAGQSGKDYANQIARDARPHFGADDQERARNVRSIGELDGVIRHDPVFHWIVSQIERLPGLGFPNPFEIDLEAGIADRLKRFVQEQVVAPLEGMGEFVQAQVDGFKALIEKPGVTIGEVFEYVDRNLLDLGIRVVRGIFSGLLTLLSDVSTLLERVLTGRLNIPFLRELFALACPGVPFTIVDGMALLVAIPTAPVMKIAGVRLSTDDPDAAAPTKWERIVFQWVTWVAAGVAHAITMVLIALNWMKTAGDKLLDTAIGYVDFCRLIVMSLSFGYGFGMFFSVSKPEGGIELHEYRTRISMWTIQALDLLTSFAVLGIKSLRVLPEIMKVISPVRTIAFAVAEGVVQLGLVVLRLIIRAPKGDAWRIAEAVLFFCQRGGVLTSRVLRSVGDIVEPKSKFTAIAKALLHGESHNVVMLSIVGAQLPRAIGETVRIAREP